MLTNMNDTYDATNLFPIASTKGTYMAYIGIGLFAIGLFPEICWLNLLLGYPLGGSFILIYVIS